ncbi:MAG: ATPase P [Ardenticatenaceae bacterium]|nr:ATPase P [Ardenticatenaceae bacterium]MCB9444335.1 ATPase P [Ardenticatenaceae bacterium]
MIEIDIPDFGELRLEHLVLDYNGTLAVDGRILFGVRERLERLASQLTIHVITADTFGKAADYLAGIPCRLDILPPGRQDEAKRDFVCKLGVANCVCVGNGRNDRLMLQEAALGIAVLQDEGAAAATLMAADAVAADIQSALELLIRPLRLIATLRS